MAKNAKQLDSAITTKKQAPPANPKTTGTSNPLGGFKGFSKGPKPLQIVINPNFPLTERPIVALSVAALTDTVFDLDITSDHLSRHTCMGTEQGVTVSGDLAMARYIARWSKASSLSPENPDDSGAVDTWVDYAQSLKYIEKERRITAISLTLEHSLQNTTFLVGYALTLADLAVFAAAGFPTQNKDLKECLDLMPTRATTARRWVKMMSSNPFLQSATQLCIGVGGHQDAIFDEIPLEPLVQGMCPLEGAIPGRVVTRFPPEPSGYLHIGHAKAVLLNDYYAKHYRGRLILRFDDTNPSKEKEEYQESIIEDLAKLGVTPNLVTFTSDYLGTIAEYAKFMITEGLAYMDDTPQEMMKVERGERKESKHRNQMPEEALKYFKLMCSGSEEGASWCLRAKIDMSSDNGTLRDPVLFRQNLTPHHRSGTKYKAYPTYDLACPIVDSIEGVTHALRTTEYDDRNAQYQWIQKALGVRRSLVHTFSRVNFKNTVLSKRKLTWFVENGYVTGWDDARFPTIRGVVRRGINITALRKFMYSIGASKRVVLMDWMVFWSENRKEADKTAKRFMAVNAMDNNVSLTVSNAPSGIAFVETALHPKEPSLGNRALRIAEEIFLETADVEGISAGEEIVLIHWGVVKITSVSADLKSFEGEHIPNGDVRAAKRKLTWVAKVPENTPARLFEFDNLVSKDKIEEDDKFEDFINPNTLAVTSIIGDSGLKSLQQNEVIQLERRGYFRVEHPYVNDAMPLVLYMIPDGKSKAMSGQTGKLAHR